MPGKDVAPFGTTLSADGLANGYLTVASTSGFFVKARALLSNPGASLSQEVIITEIVDATHVGVQFVPTKTYLYPSNYGRSNCSAFTLAGASRLDMPSQFIYAAP